MARRATRQSWWSDTAIPGLKQRVKAGYYDAVTADGTAVMREDWDTLLILDACRNDMFVAQNSISGDLGTRLSKGSNTVEFFEENFSGTGHHDTVYVTANPVPRVDVWCSVDLDAVFHDVVDVWAESWDEEANTVRPEVTESAIREAHEEYPDKRIIGHFIQPHQPFIGPEGAKIEESGMTVGNEFEEAGASADEKVWEQLRNNDVSSELVWHAYCENLDIVLPYAERLCEDLDGKFVVTSDHGNLLGEFLWPFPEREYGHPPGIRKENLVKVPWLEVPYQRRRNIVEEPPVASAADAGESERLERLEALGYR